MRIGIQRLRNVGIEYGIGYIHNRTEILKIDRQVWSVGSCVNGIR